MKECFPRRTVSLSAADRFVAADCVRPARGAQQKRGEPRFVVPFTVYSRGRTVRLSVLEDHRSQFLDHVSLL